MDDTRALLAQQKAQREAEADAKLKASFKYKAAMLISRMGDALQGMRAKIDGA